MQADYDQDIAILADFADNCDNPVIVAGIERFIKFLISLGDEDAEAV